MFKDTLVHRCTIYRQQTSESIDLSASSEGEVTETWGVVEVNARALFAPEDTPYKRGSVGIQDIGSHSAMVEADCDVKNADRIYRAEGDEGDPEYFDVRRVKYIKNIFDEVLHKELSLEHVPWMAPVYTSLYFQDEGISIRQMTFSYTDTTKLITDIVGGDQLLSLTVQVIVPFDDSGAILSISDSEVTLVTDDMVDLTIPNNLHKETLEDKVYLANDYLNVAIDKGISTQGAGIIFAEVLMQS